MLKTQKTKAIQKNKKLVLYYSDRYQCFASSGHGIYNIEDNLPVELHSNDASGIIFNRYEFPDISKKSTIENIVDTFSEVIDNKAKMKRAFIKNISEGVFALIG